MFSAATKTMRAGGDDPLELSFLRSNVGGYPADPRDIAVADLGKEHRNRKIYVVMFGRTNNTTGDRRFLSCNLIVGGMTFTGTRIAANFNTTNVDNPCAVWEIECPEGVSGTVRISVSGGGTRLAQIYVAIYAAIGTFSRVDADALGGNTVTLDTVNRGAAVTGHFAAAVTTNISCTGCFDFEDLRTFGNGAGSAIIGRNDPTDAPSVTTTPSSAGRSLGFSLSPSRG